jgi:8-oxo-dGTP pyrophosphatase MutT (NUDIX family)
MDLSLFRQKDFFPSLVTDKLTTVTIDYKEKHSLIAKANKTDLPHLEAGVVLLLNYKSNQKKPEYVFQLIKRSEKVTQAGDISCPGGILHPRVDKILSFFLKIGIIPAMREKNLNYTAYNDKETISLIRLFLTNALREAWEEIGLIPFNISFLCALPCYSLTSFAITIYPLVCLTPKPFKYRLSSEVEKILEIPLSFFFQSSNYASLEIETPTGDNASSQNNKFPCLIIPDDRGNVDILWGATFNIITNFLRIISDDSLPLSSASRTVKKVLTDSYISGNR